MATPVPISSIVSVSISAESGVQSREAFATPMIIDSEYVYGATARVLTVGSLQEMLDAGYNTYDRAYEMARIAFSQTNRPSQIKIGQWQDGSETLAAAWAAIIAYDPAFYMVCMTDRTAADIQGLADQTLGASGVYLAICESGDADVLANGVGNIGKVLKDGSYTRSFLAYNPATVQVSTLVFTGTSTAGSFQGSIDGTTLNVAWNTSHAQTLTDIATAIQAVGTVATAASNGTDTITITSAHALNRNALTISADLTDATSVWTVTTAAQAPLDAAIVSYLSGNDPGSKTTAGAPIAGVTASSLTTAQRNNLLANNVSTLLQYGPSITRVTMGSNAGKVSDGSLYADQRVTIDWLQIRIEDEVFALLASGTPTPYTQEGIQRVGNAIAAALSEGVKRGVVAPSGDLNDGDLGKIGYTVSLPLISAISDANKAARILPDVTFQARGAGAIQSVTIKGTLTI